MWDRRAFMALIANQGASVPMVTLPQNLLSATPTLIEDFETGFAKTAGDTVADDTTNFHTGTHSVRLTATSTLTKADKTTNIDISASGAGFRFWIYKYSGTVGATIYLGGNATFSKCYQFNIEPAQIPYAGWNAVDFQVRTATNVAGGMTVNDPIVKIRIQVAVGGDYSFDSLYTVPRQSGAVMLRFDDGYDSVYTPGKAILSAHRVRANIYAVSNSLGTAGVMTSAQLLEMQADGHLICNHTADHPDLRTLTEEQQEAQFSECTSDLAALGITTAAYYAAYPIGYYDANTIAAMTNLGMRFGTNTVWAGTAYQQFLPPPIPFEVGAVRNLSSTVSLATAKTYVDDAVTHKYILSLMGHKLTAGAPPADGYSWNASDYNELVAYVVASGLPIITMDDIHNLQTGTVNIPQAI